MLCLHKGLIRERRQSCENTHIQVIQVIKQEETKYKT